MSELKAFIDQRKIQLLCTTWRSRQNTEYPRKGNQYCCHLDHLQQYLGWFCQVLLLFASIAGCFPASSVPIADDTGGTGRERVEVDEGKEGAQSVRGSASAVMSMELLSQGAEARVFSSTFCGRPAVVKERFRKVYRLPELDEKLTTRRTLQEARCMLKVRKAGVRTPCLYQLDSANTKITMEKIDGVTAKRFLLDCFQHKDTSTAMKVAGEIGKMVAKMHDAQVVHGDLTTSNFMIRSGSEEVVAIDFGLASSQPLPEDKAVDLYVLERAFISTHEDSERLVNEVLRAYKAASRKADTTLHKLSEVRRRGRKREMFG